MNPSVERIVRTADAAIPEQPPIHQNHAKLILHREMLLAGIAWEMALLKPSYPELGRALGCAHTTAIQHLMHWRQLPWAERYGWLRLVEGRLAHDTLPLDENAVAIAS